MSTIQIESVTNGYIFRNGSGFGSTEVFKTLDEVFARLLIKYEGRAPSFTGSAFGAVHIERGSD